MSMTIEEIRDILHHGTLTIGTHAALRMLERGITEFEVRSTILHGRIIEEYPNQNPFPRCLIFRAKINNRPLHVVVGVNREGMDLFLVTTYVPTLDKWESDFETRRQKNHAEE